MKGVIKVKVERCMACDRCRTACFIEHSKSKTLLGAIQESPSPWSNMQVKKVGVVSVPTNCRQCAAAVCMAVCPSGAMHREGPGEPVIVDDSLCVGCENCVLICPYGVPRMTPDHAHVEKCDQCVDRVREGRLPACVEACPTGTLTFEIQKDGGEAGETTETRMLSMVELYRRVLATEQKPGGEDKP